MYIPLINNSVTFMSRFDALIMILIVDGIAGNYTKWRVFYSEYNQIW